MRHMMSHGPRHWTASKEVCLPRPPVIWSPCRRGVVSTVNCRINHAVLRTYREVRLNPDPNSLGDPASALWPAIRLERKALQVALRISWTAVGVGSKRRRPAQPPNDKSKTGPLGWLESLTDPGTCLPLDPPDGDALRFFGAALSREAPPFRLHLRCGRATARTPSTADLAYSNSTLMRLFVSRMDLLALTRSSTPRFPSNACEKRNGRARGSMRAKLPTRQTARHGRSHTRRFCERSQTLPGAGGCWPKQQRGRTNWTPNTGTSP
jgi:hypothetical protein